MVNESAVKASGDSRLLADELMKKNVKLRFNVKVSLVQNNSSYNDQQLF